MDRLSGQLKGLGLSQELRVRSPPCLPISGDLMGYRVKLQWGIAIEIPPSGMIALDSSNLLFNRKGGNGFLRSIGGRIRTTYAPIVLEPTDVFHSTLNPLRKSLKITDTKFPYHIQSILPGTTSRLNVKFNLFGKILFINLILDEFKVESSFNISNVQKLESHPDIVKLALQILAITITQNRQAPPLSSLPRYYPAIHLVSLGEDPVDWRARMATLVSRHAMMLDSAAKKMLEKNNSHQVDQSLLLVDKQGIGAYIPFTAPATEEGNFKRFRNAVSMLEFAVVLQLQLSKKTTLPQNVLNLITSPDEAIADSVSAQNLWKLFSIEFHLLIELKYAQPKERSKSMQRILLVTVTPVESTAVLTAFTEATGQKPKAIRINNYVYQELGVVGGFECFLAISEMGSGGTAGSQLSIQRAIQEIKPEAVIMVGIAFGIDKSKFSIGDILVSKQLLLYDLQRVNADSTISLRGDRVSASAAPLSWLRHALLSWPEISPAKVEPGLVLSGEKLIDNIDYRNALKAAASEALGGEMEGAGLYIACQNAKVDWLLIKAVCDWADGKKNKNKKANQLTAANSAAKFAVHILTSTPA